MEDIYVTKRELAGILLGEIGRQEEEQSQSEPHGNVSVAYMHSQIKAVLQRLFDAL